MLLPDPDKGDLFFDFEGDPLWTADGRSWGLEYLFGVYSTRPTSFHPLWAHDRAEERQALEDFLAMVRKRRRRYPNMHIYHYARLREDGTAAAGRPLRRRRGRCRRPAAQRRAGRPFPVGTQEHSGGHGELQPQVARAAVHGRGPAHGEVTTAADSITEYARYCELRDDGRDRRGGGAAQGDRGVQPLRLPVDPQTAGLVDGAGHSNAASPPHGPAIGPRRAARSKSTTTSSRSCRVRRRRASRRAPPNRRRSR